MVEVRRDTFSNILRGGVPNTVLEDVRAELARERAEHLIDPVELRIARDWSYLSGQVFGAENPRRYD